MKTMRCRPADNASGHNLRPGFGRFRERSFLRAAPKQEISRYTAFGRPTRVVLYAPDIRQPPWSRCNQSPLATPLISLYSIMAPLSASADSRSQIPDLKSQIPDLGYNFRVLLQRLTQFLFRLICPGYLRLVAHLD